MVMVTVYWRPGCPFCLWLRLVLRVRGARAQWVNIWDDPTAAAFVRSVADGNETVPTVVINGHPLVNPAPRRVAAAASTLGLIPGPARPGSTPPPRSLPRIESLATGPTPQPGGD